MSVNSSLTGGGTCTVTLQVAYLPLPSAAVAVIVTVPAFMAVTRPELSTEAILVLLELQTMRLLLALVGFTEALSVRVVPVFMLRLDELMLTDDTGTIGIIGK